MLLQKEHEELKETLKRFQETFSAELLVETEKELLPEELDSVTISNHEDCSKLPGTTKTPSFWKRARHFLGLRKPEKWKKKKE